jgi:hypothetical protein
MSYQDMEARQTFVCPSAVTFLRKNMCIWFKGHSAVEFEDFLKVGGGSSLTLLSFHRHRGSASAYNILTCPLIESRKRCKICHEYAEWNHMKGGSRDHLVGKGVSCNFVY